jgi:hypothetical protein
MTPRQRDFFSIGLPLLITISAATGQYFIVKANVERHDVQLREVDAKITTLAEKLENSMRIRVALSTDVETYKRKVDEMSRSTEENGKSLSRIEGRQEAVIRTLDSMTAKIDRHMEK